MPEGVPVCELPVVAGTLHFPECPVTAAPIRAAALAESEPRAATRANGNKGKHRHGGISDDTTCGTE